MAKSLEELELAFKVQYPKVEKKKVEKKRRFKKQSPVDGQAESIPKEITQAVRPEDESKETVKEDPSMTLEEELEGSRMTAEDKPEAMSGIIQKKEEADDTITLTILDLLFYGVLVLMIVGSIIFSKEARGNQWLGGKSFYEVTTTSMQSIYPKGSLVFVKDIEPHALVVNDDIAFTNEEGAIIISRIIEVKEELDESNNQVFVTLGVNEQEGNDNEVLADKVIGEVTGGIPLAGVILNWIGNNLLLVFAMIGVLIVTLIGMGLFRRKKRNSKKVK